MSVDLIGQARVAGDHLRPPYKEAGLRETPKFPTVAGSSLTKLPDRGPVAANPPADPVLGGSLLAQCHRARPVPCLPTSDDRPIGWHPFISQAVTGQKAV